MVVACVLFAQSVSPTNTVFQQLAVPADGTQVHMDVRNIGQTYHAFQMVVNQGCLSQNSFEADSYFDPISTSSAPTNLVRQGGTNQAADPYNATTNSIVVNGIFARLRVYANTNGGCSGTIYYQGTTNSLSATTTGLVSVGATGSATTHPPSMVGGNFPSTYGLGVIGAYALNDLGGAFGGGVNGLGVSGWGDGIVAGIRPTPLIACVNSATFSVTAGSTTRIAHGLAGTSLKLCGITAGSTTAASSFGLVYGTGTNCGTGTTSLVGSLPLNTSSITMGGGLGVILSVPLNQDLCVSAVTGTVNGFISYAAY